MYLFYYIPIKGQQREILINDVAELVIKTTGYSFEFYINKTSILVFKDFVLLG